VRNLRVWHTQSLLSGEKQPSFLHEPAVPAIPSTNPHHTAPHQKCTAQLYTQTNKQTRTCAHTHAQPIRTSTSAISERGEAAMFCPFISCNRSVQSTSDDGVIGVVVWWWSSNRRSNCRCGSSCRAAWHTAPSRRHRTDRSVPNWFTITFFVRAVHLVSVYYGEVVVRKV
jgi:hypothetical protein